MSSAPIPEGVPPGAPVVPQGPVPAVGVPNSQDYPRLVYTAPRFEVVAIADIIEPSVLEACEALLPTLVPPYVNQAAIDAVNATAVRRAGDTMTGPLNLSPVIPTANAMAASKQYVDTMIATGAIPEVPPVPAGQAWARETGQWIPLAGGGTVTNIVTGAGLTGGPITATGTIAMANMAGNTLKGNNTGAVAAPTDLNVGQVMTMLGAAPLNSPAFTGTPSLPTGTAAVTQLGGTSNTTVATTAFVMAAVTSGTSAALQLSGGTMTGPIVLAGNAAAALNPVPLQQLTTSLAGYAPIASPVFSGSPSLPAASFGVTQSLGTSNTSLATTAFVAAGFLPLSGGTLSGNLGVLGPTGISYSTFTAGGADGATHSYRFGWTGGNLVVDIDGAAAVPLFNVAGGTFTGPVTAPTPFTISGLAQGVLKLNSGSREWDWISNQGDSACYLNDFTGSASRLQINTNGTCVNTTGSWIAFSDPRVKTDMAPYDGGLQAVLSLQPITYRYNGLHGTAEDPEGTLRYGLDAAETQKVMPELVGTSSLPDHDELLTVDTGPLIFALVNAFKEIKAEFDAFKAGRTA